LCEKPFARNIEEARQMKEAADEAGVLALVGTEFRYATGQALAARAIREGIIGEPKLATFMMHVPVLADPASEVPDWWSSKEDGGGWLGAYCSHLIDQIRSTLGEITGLSASLALVSNHDWSTEDSYTVHFRTASGCDGVLQSSAGAWGPMLINTRFAGPGGTLWIEGEDVVKVADSQGIRILDVPEDLKTLAASAPPAEFMKTAYDYLHAAGFDIGPYTKVFEYMRDAILGKELPTDPVPASFADGLKSQEILDGIRKSAEEHCWVSLAKNDS
jgi:predicted dehydrogenase